MYIFYNNSVFGDFYNNRLIVIKLFKSECDFYNFQFSHRGYRTSFFPFIFTLRIPLKLATTYMYTSCIFTVSM
jgi:hypothetical protein